MPAYLVLFENWTQIDADADADAETSSSNTRSYTVHFGAYIVHRMVIFIINFILKSDKATVKIYILFYSDEKVRGLNVCEKHQSHFQV